MNGTGYVISLTNCDFGYINRLTSIKKISIVEDVMKTLIKNNPLAVLLMTPALAFVLHRLALELWCIAYGLIY